MACDDCSGLGYTQDENDEKTKCDCQKDHDFRSFIKGDISMDELFDRKDVEIEKIFKELGIEGDIAPDEDNVNFWKRKLVEVYERCKEWNLKN